MPDDKVRRLHFLCFRSAHEHLNNLKLNYITDDHSFRLDYIRLCFEIREALVRMARTTPIRVYYHLTAAEEARR